MVWRLIFWCPRRKLLGILVVVVLLVCFLLSAHRLAMHITSVCMCGDSSRDPRYIGHAADDAYDTREMFPIVNSELERQNRGVAVLLIDRDVVDVCLGARDRCGHRRKY